MKCCRLRFNNYKHNIQVQLTNDKINAKYAYLTINRDETWPHAACSLLRATRSTGG